ncbi:UNVERIFIED_CONTAM: hypothetical protein GTU68_044107 [Idotea baltica]|nr:hypothetical protein [Idotea baltica]
MTTTVQCPNCRKPVAWNAQAKWKPFCSERCKLIDLGDWAEGNHRIASAKVDDTFSDDFDYH